MSIRDAWIGLLALCACAPDRDGAPGRFGEITSAVVLVNPVINEGSTTTVQTGSMRSGVRFEATGTGRWETDATGLAVVEGLPTGEIVLGFDDGELGFTVIQERELYDLAVAVHGGVAHVFPPVRYPIGGEVLRLHEGDDIGEAAREDGSILLLDPGRYAGGLDIRAQNVLIFGAWSPDEGPLSIIEGDVTVRGGNGRIRGVRIEGIVTSAANGFSLAFSGVEGANVTGNGVTLLRNRFGDGPLNVPSSNAVLVDNEGLP